MKFRTTLILALFLALGIAGVVYLNKEDAREEETKKSSDKIVSYHGSAIQEISVAPVGIMARRDSSRWRILRPVQTDADDAVLNAIADMFEWARIERVVSSEPAAYASFGLQPPRAILTLATGTEQDTLYIGDDSQVGSFVYARQSGRPDVFMTTTSLWNNINKTLFDFRDKNILTFQQSQANAVEIKNSLGLFQLTKAGSDWEMRQPRAYRADSKKIDEIMNRVAYQRATGFVDDQPVTLAAYGLDKPAFIFSVTLGADKAQKTLRIGNRVEAKYYAMDAAKPPVFMVDSAFVHSLRVTVDDLRNKTLGDDLFAQADYLELVVGDTTYACRKDTADQWSLLQPVSRKAKNWKMISILSDLQTLTAVGFASDDPASLKPFGLDRPRIQGRVFLQEQKLFDLALGKSKDDNTIYARRGGDETVYLIKKVLLDKLQLSLTDLAEPDQAVQAITQGN